MDVIHFRPVAPQEMYYFLFFQSVMFLPVICSFSREWMAPPFISHLKETSFKIIQVFGFSCFEVKSRFSGSKDVSALMANNDTIK